MQQLRCCCISILYNNLQASYTTTYSIQLLKCCFLPVNRKVIIKQNVFLFTVVFSYFWLATGFVLLAIFLYAKWNCTTKIDLFKKLAWLYYTVIYSVHFVCFFAACILTFSAHSPSVPPLLSQVSDLLLSFSFLSLRLPLPSPAPSTLSL